MSEAFTIWAGVAIMAFLAIAQAVLNRKNDALQKRIQEGLAEYRKEVREFEERHGVDDE